MLSEATQSQGDGREQTREQKSSPPAQGPVDSTSSRDHVLRQEQGETAKGRQ